MSILHLFILCLADLIEILCKNKLLLIKKKNNNDEQPQLKHTSTLQQTSMYLEILPKSLFLPLSAVTDVLIDSRSVSSAFNRASELICWTFIS